MYTKVTHENITLNESPLATMSSEQLLDKITTHHIEASSLEKGDAYIEILQEAMGANQFLLALQYAFNDHKAICITPDHLWLLICQGFAEHIKLYADKFRDKFVSFEGKQKLEVRRDDFVKGESNPWEEVFPAFTEQIQEHSSEDIYTHIALRFSTSGIKETTAFDIALMDTMSEYFSFQVTSLCGIPEIVLKGIVEDYEKILASLAYMRQYDLETWVDGLVAIIEECIYTVSGTINHDFWNDIYKQDNMSGGPYITGWITKFFPYTIHSVVEEKPSLSIFQLFRKQKPHPDLVKELDRQDVGDIMIHRGIMPNPHIEDGNSLLKIDSFPSGISRVPFVWSYYLEIIEMSFLSGFIGMKEDDSGCLVPEINWVIVE